MILYYDAVPNLCRVTSCNVSPNYNAVAPLAAVKLACAARRLSSRRVALSSAGTGKKKDPTVPFPYFKPPLIPSCFIKKKASTNPRCTTRSVVTGAGRWPEMRSIAFVSAHQSGPI
ncbi:hypothetical protein PVAP13_5KG098600 [Panicum virgatum]|uniref:Uncharacterized protein n=1 Tax=Panicum virgatum TaxID=38727 RepID=A0A8T0SFV3_PANVG|nr:hypothetical protein PVAP13_5KG098600 [Panicum virgatum]